MGGAMAVRRAVCMPARRLGSRILCSRVGDDLRSVRSPVNRPLPRGGAVAAVLLLGSPGYAGSARRRVESRELAGAGRSLGAVAFGACLVDGLRARVRRRVQPVGRR